MKIYGYARVSARDQNMTRQLEAFRAFGIPDSRIYCDRKSGKDFERSNYLRMLEKLRGGDLLVIKSIDRLGRNYGMIIEEWRRITKIIRADILVLDIPLLDTRVKENSLVGRFISDVVLQVLSFVAENERENIRLRQAEGIAAAKKSGVRFGRPSAGYSDTFAAIEEAYTDHKITLRTALSITGMSQSNFYYHLHKYQKKRLQK